MKGRGNRPAFSGLLFAFSIHATMLPAVTAPSFGSKSASLCSGGQQVRLWRQVTNLGPAKRASAFLLRMDIVARQVLMAAGRDVITNGDGRTRF